VADQRKVSQLMERILAGTDIDFTSAMTKRVLELIARALDTGNIPDDEIVEFYTSAGTIATGTVNLEDKIVRLERAETIRAEPRDPLDSGVGEPAVEPVDEVDGGTDRFPTPQEAADFFGDPDLARAPQSVINWLARITDSLEGGFIYGDYDPRTGEIQLFDPRGESQIFTILNNGATIVPKEVAGAGSDRDIAAANLANAQASQIRALMRGDLIELSDGRSVIRGTTTIVDTREAGVFAPVEGIPGTFFDPVSGTFVDTNGQQLARDRFEFEKNFILPEEQRQFDESLAVDKENISSQNRRAVLSSLVELQGQKDARGIAGAQAAADPGNFVAAENIRRGLAPPVQGETPLFQDVDFGGIGLADIIAGLSGGTQGAAPSTAGPSAATPERIQAVSRDVAPGTPQSAIEAVAGAERPTSLGISTGIAEMLGLTGQTQLDLTDPANVQLARDRGVALPPGFATGGATTSPAFQVGDPVPGSGDKANPEVILNPENAPIQVIRLADVVKNGPKFFAGTSTGLRGAGRDEPTLADLGTLQGRSRGMLGNTGRQIPTLSDPGTVQSAIGGASPSIPTLASPGTLQNAVQPLNFSQLRQDPTAPVARTTRDEDIQQTPGLRFIQGGQGAGDDFNRLSTDTIQGAFGTGLPLAGALNFTRAQEALQDPITGPLLSALFRSASLNFAGEVERARKRAPTGLSQFTSLVRT